MTLISTSSSSLLYQPSPPFTHDSSELPDTLRLDSLHECALPEIHSIGFFTEYLGTAFKGALCGNAA